MPMTVFHEAAHPRKGERCSASAAYLEPALKDASKHPHLSTQADAHVRRILFENDRHDAAADAHAGTPL